MTTTRKKRRILFLGLILVILFFISIGCGRYFIPFNSILRFLCGQDISEIEETIILNIRLPRCLMAVFIGAGLSVSGAALQAMFSNPLVSPHILGVSYGAGFGAALGILFFGNAFFIQVLAIAFGVLAILITYKLSLKNGRIKLFMLVLSGVIVGSVFQALISFIKYVADPEEKLPAIVYWLMGSLSGATLKDVLTAVPTIILGILILYLIRWKLNVISLDDEEAESMGINVKNMRMITVGAVSLITAAAVSISGIIGFIGLVVPHLCRMIVGCDNKHLVPASIFIGGTYLLAIDTLSRTISAAEIPLSILTALIGAPFFAYLLKATGGRWDD